MRHCRVPLDIAARSIMQQRCYAAVLIYRVPSRGCISGGVNEQDIAVVLLSLCALYKLLVT
jgi:hypothetical protein